MSENEVETGNEGAVETTEAEQQPPAEPVAKKAKAAQAAANEPEAPAQ